jgi:hypothetical protein
MVKKGEEIEVHNALKTGQEEIQRRIKENKPDVVKLEKLRL